VERSDKGTSGGRKQVALSVGPNLVGLILLNRDDHSVITTWATAQGQSVVTVEHCCGLDRSGTNGQTRSLSTGDTSLTNHKVAHIGVDVSDLAGYRDLADQLRAQNLTLG
jgi:hypothetical protein